MTEKQRKLKYSEHFSSVQGEGRFVGVPSIFLRTFGCNFQCRLFGQSRDPKQQVELKDMDFMNDPKADKNHPEAYKSIEELPIAQFGCDSSASWAAKYKHLAKENTAQELVEQFKDLMKRQYFDNGKNDIHLVITGGEPLLPKWQYFWPELIEECLRMRLKNLTFETNGTKKLTDEFRDFLNDYQRVLHITWSTSPKLSLSGEPWDKAIVPEALKSYNEVKSSYLYTKFVVRDEQDYPEVDEALDAYKRAGVNVSSVYLMPEGATTEQLALTEKQVAEYCIKSGYRFSPRLHCQLFGNQWGT